MSEDDKQDVLMLPEGRVINHNLIVRDQYEEGAALKYTVELAFEEGELNDLYDACCDFADEEFGAGTGDSEAEGGLYVPVLSGDKLAARREKKGKVGDAYKGMEVVRISTKFNKYGDEDAGGAAVYMPDAETEITAANKSELYPGMYGVAAIVLKGYEKTVQDADGDDERIPAITLYLQAFQKTKDGDKLSSGSDKSQLFKPVGKASKKDGGRKRRKG